MNNNNSTVNEILKNKNSQENSLEMEFKIPLIPKQRKRKLSSQSNSKDDLVMINNNITTTLPKIILKKLPNSTDYIIINEEQPQKVDEIILISTKNLKLQVMTDMEHKLDEINNYILKLEQEFEIYYYLNKNGQNELRIIIESISEKSNTLKLTIENEINNYVANLKNSIHNEKQKLRNRTQCIEMLKTIKAKEKMICNKSECIKPNVRNFKYEPQKLSHVWSTILLILLFLPLTGAMKNTFSNSN